MDNAIEIKKFAFNPVEIFQLAWTKLDGAKGPIVITAIINMAISFVGTYILLMVGMPQMLVSLAQVAISALLFAAIVRMAFRHYQGSPIEVSDAFYYLKNAELLVPILLAQVLVGALIGIGMMLLIVPGLYLAATYILTMPLVIDRKLPFWEAMETSRKMLTANLLSALVYLLLWVILAVIAIIPFGIGLIWVIPMLAISIVILYDKAFGIQNQF